MSHKQQDLNEDKETHMKLFITAADIAGGTVSGYRDYEIHAFFDRECSGRMQIPGAVGKRELPEVRTWE